MLYQCETTLKNSDSVEFGSVLLGNLYWFFITNTLHNFVSCATIRLFFFSLRTVETSLLLSAAMSFFIFPLNQHLQSLSTRTHTLIECNPFIPSILQKIGAIQTNEPVARVRQCHRIVAGINIIQMEGALFMWGFLNECTKREKQKNYSGDEL